MTAASARQNILFLMPSLASGGAERMVITVLTHIDRSRFRLTLALLDGEPSALRDEVPADVEIVDLRTRRARHSLLAIVRLVRRLKPAVVFTVIGHLNLALATVKPFLPRGTRLIARETNVLTEMLRTQGGSALWRLGYRYLYRRLDLVICQSVAMRRELTEVFHLPAGKSLVIRNPLDIDRIRTLSRDPLPAGFVKPDAIWLVAVGRLGWEKGFDLLIEAIGLLPEPRPFLTILGEGPLRASLEALTVKCGVDHCVSFAGFQANPHAWVARAGALVLSSRYESFPNVVLEAFACGTPVIATPALGGLSELLPGPAGSVVAAAITAQALANAIATFPFGNRKVVATPELGEYSVAHISGIYEQLFAPEPAAA